MMICYSWIIQRRKVDMAGEQVVWGDVGQVEKNSVIPGQYSKAHIYN